MRSHELTARCSLNYCPPGTCNLDFGISEGLAALVGTSDLAAAAAPAVGTLAGTADLTAAAGGAAAAGGLASSLPSLAMLGQVAGLAGSGISALGQINQANAAASADRASAAALAIRAGQDAAAGEQTQIARERQSQLVLSRAQALAAASGGGATDPSVITGEENLAQQGEYNAQTGLYEGLAQARADTLQQQIDLFNAQQKEAAGPIAAFGTLLSGIGGFYDKRAMLKSQNLDLPFMPVNR